VIKMKNLLFDIAVILFVLAYSLLVFESGRMMERRWAREREYKISDPVQNNLVEGEHGLLPWRLDQLHKGLRPI
jgi:hypothetical protein